MSDALGVCVGRLLHEGLGSLPELFLGPLHRVLICRLNQGDYDIRVNLDISGVNELEQALQNLWLDVRNGDLPLAPLNEGPIKHFLKDLRRGRKDLSMSEDPLLVGMHARNNHDICEVF